MLANTKADMKKCTQRVTEFEESGETTVTFMNHTVIRIKHSLRWSEAVFWNDLFCGLIQVGSSSSPCLINQWVHSAPVGPLSPAALLATWSRWGLSFPWQDWCSMSGAGSKGLPLAGPCFIPNPYQILLLPVWILNTLIWCHICPLW